MYNRSESFFKGYKNLELFFQIWDNPEAKGTVIITHGHGEHSESYHRLTTAFQKDAWTFYGWDLRGHGRSAGKRGYVEEFDDYCRDFRIFLDMVLSQDKVRQGPVVLFCHSMGGLIQLKTLLRNTDIKFDAMIVSSPLLGLTMPVPAIKAGAAKLMNNVLPSITMDNGLQNNMLTRDLDVIREYEQDPLRHTRMSPAAFLGMLESFEFVNPRANQLKHPSLFILPEADPVVSTPAARAFYDNLGSSQKEIFIYPDSKHELINDINRETVFADLKKYLDSVLESRA